MEEIIYFLPFNHYGNAFLIAVVVIAFVAITLILKAFRTPFNLILASVGALFFMLVSFYQAGAVEKLKPLVDLPQRQDQLDQQLITDPLPLDGANLQHVKVRFNSLTLDFTIDEATYKQMKYDNLTDYADYFTTNNREIFCNILKLEQQASYRQNDRLFNLAISQFSLNITSGNEHYSHTYTPQNFGCF